MSGYTLGGDTAWKVKAVGDMVLAYHWINDEPTMMIYPRYRRLRLNSATPWGMPLTAAHELIDNKVKGKVNTAELLAKATRCAQCMGIEPNYPSIRSIADLILHGLDDLIRMPPTPTKLLEHQQRNEAGLAGGVMQFKADGKTVIEREV